MKQVSLYTLGDNKTNTLSDLADVEFTQSLLQRFRFSECTAEQTKSIGFSRTILGESETPLVANSRGDYHFSITTQDKKINKHLVNTLTEAKVLKWKEETGVEGAEPNKELLKVFKDEATQEVVTTTFPDEPKKFTVIVRKDGIVLVEGKGNNAENLVSLLRKAIGSFPVVPLQTERHPEDLLDELISKSVSDIICLGSKAQFVTEEGRKVTLGGKSLYDSEAQHFMEEGMMAEAVEVCYDGMVTFLLRDTLTFEGIKFSKDLLCDHDDNDIGGTYMTVIDELNKAVNDILGRLEKVDE